MPLLRTPRKQAAVGRPVSAKSRRQPGHGDGRTRPRLLHPECPAGMICQLAANQVIVRSLSGAGQGSQRCRSLPLQLIPEVLEN